MIILEKDDYFEFSKNMMALFYFAGVSEEVIPDMSFNQFLANCVDNMPFVQKCRARIVKKPKLMSEFLTLNRHLLSPEDIKIIKDFMRRTTSTFVVMKYEEDHAVFVDIRSARVYAVKALTEPFSDIFPPLPVRIDAAIMPFKDVIVYDGVALVNTLKEKVSDTLIELCDEQIKKGKLITSF